jgi:NTP pyrophosphatase (non-canonical NTP hydrolase)
MAKHKIQIDKAAVLNELAKEVHIANKKWWTNPATGEPIERNRAEMLMLVVSEIAEAMEGERKNLMDDKLPHRKMAEVELADAVIRIFDYAAGLGYDLGGAYVEKMSYNAVRKDHTAAERLKANGKKF